MKVDKNIKILVKCKHKDSRETGTAIFSDVLWKVHLKLAKKVFCDNGDKQSIFLNKCDYEFSSLEEYLDMFTTKKISDKEAKQLCKTLGIKENNKVELGRKSAIGDFIAFDEEEMVSIIARRGNLAQKWLVSNGFWI